MADFGEPPMPPWDPSGPEPYPHNPYGYWDRRGGTYCRLTEPLYLCSLCGDKTPEDPTGFELYFVIFVHCMSFAAPIYMLWGIYQKLDIIKKRIYSPFFLIVASAIFEAGSMAEVASHAMTMNWNSCYDTANTPMKAFFYAFTSIGFSGLTIAYRKKDFPPLRKPTDTWDWCVYWMDLALIALSVLNPVVYYALDKKYSLYGFIVVNTFSAFVGIPRIWKNMGPTRELLIWASISQFCSIAGVGVNVIMQRTGNQYLHALLGGLFAANEFGLGYCFLLIQDVPDDKPAGQATSLL